MDDTSAPLILTLAFDDASFARFDELRRLHFPPERNLIPAHLTLFHHLPGGEHEGEVAGVVGDACRMYRPMTLRVTGLRFMGKGVAYTLESPELARLRGLLAEAWFGWLTGQDRQKFRPHVTVQNKVEPEVARALHERLSAEFAPFEAEGRGLLLWRYRGGPWEQVGEYPFGAATGG
jgi:2'-5' RNA ligase